MTITLRKITTIPTLCALLLALIGLLCVGEAWTQGPGYNEFGRLASGLFYLKTGDFSPFHVNPPLTSMAAGLPSAALGAKSATRADLGISNFARDEFDTGEFFIKNNRENNRLLLFWGRLCCIALMLLGIALGARLAGELYGGPAKIVFLLLAGFSPFYLGHGTMVGPDAASGLFAVAAVMYFRRWLRAADLAGAFTAGLALGVAELTKFTLLILYPLFPILWLLDRLLAPAPRRFKIGRELGQFCVLIAASFLVINIGYLFEGTGQRLGDYRFETLLFTGCSDRQEIPSAGGNRFSMGNRWERALGRLPMPLPKNFIQGIDTQRYDFERGIQSYMRGTWSEHGWWYFYLYALLLKTPLGIEALFLLAVLCTFFFKKANAPCRDELLILLPGITLMVFLSSQSGFSIHSRYALAALPFFFVWTSKLGRLFERPAAGVPGRGTRAVRFLAVFFLTAGIGSSLAAYPHNIAYFNDLTALIPTPEVPDIPRQEPRPRLSAFLDLGSRHAPRHLLDSNIEWGQTLGDLERWCRKHPEVQTIHTLLSPHDYPVDQTDIPAALNSDLEESGWYAVSVCELYGSQTHTGKVAHAFRRITPVTVLGNTIYIYHLTGDDYRLLRKLYEEIRAREKEKEQQTDKK